MLETMSKHSFVIVSNRLPISVSKQHGKLKYDKASGGLATAMSSLKDDDMVWVGWCGMPSDDLSTKEKQAIREEFAKAGAMPVFLTKAQIELFYEGYSNDTLWPLFHYFQSTSRYVDEYWNAYNEVNELYAAATRQVSQTHARIWVHDYQLMLLPRMIRQSLAKATIGFFLHIPFPSYEIFRLLPERTQLLEGVMGADVVGFHVYDYARHFMSSCRRLLGVNPDENTIEYEGRMVYIGTYPIGIDYDKFAATAVKSDVKKIERMLKRRYAKQRIILSVDRLDYSKGIPQRLEAYRLFLEQYPEYRGNVVLQMIAVPSRTEVSSYQELRDKIEQSVSRINGTYGTADWVPISYQFQNRPFDEIVASYASAEVMLVTPIRDGMNLVAKEYVASKQKKTGVLILSELAGAADELTEALAVNPNNPHSIADAIHAALEMPKSEQKRRLTNMQKRLKYYTVQVWAKTFLEDMQLSKSLTAPAVGGGWMTAEQQQAVAREFINAKRPLIILDYDGTLKPYQASPSMLAGFPSLRVRLLLTLLLQKAHVAIVSGRPRKVMNLWFKGLKLDLAAEHGARVRLGGTKWRTAENEIKKAKPAIKRLMDTYAAATPGARIEEKEYSLVWHYRNVEPELGYNRTMKLRQDLLHIVDKRPIDVSSGQKIIEVKQRNINKGKVVADLMNAYHPDFVLCAGDDFTDEDMFRALAERGYTIKIGNGETIAQHRLPSVESLLKLLTKLVGKKTLISSLRHPLARRR